MNADLRTACAQRDLRWTIRAMVGAFVDALTLKQAINHSGVKRDIRAPARAAEAMDRTRARSARRRRGTTRALALSLCLVCGTSQAQALSFSRPPKAVEQRLARGVNVSHWFAQSDSGYAEKQLSTFFTAEDARLLRRAGFTHVRLPVSMEWAFKPGPAGVAFRSSLVEAVTMINAAGLAVIVDLHPSNDEKKALFESGADADLVNGWRMLAGLLGRHRHADVLFEVMNEPYPFEGERWRTLQAKVIEAIRSVAPGNTVIANPGGWSGVDAFADFIPYAYANLIYTAHIYEPMLFTHQGATWAWIIAGQVAGVDWPIDQSAAADHAARAGLTEDAAKNLRDQIADGQFELAWLLQRMDRLAQWQRQHGNPAVYIGEFGVFQSVAPRPASLRWHQEMRRAFEAHGWGWGLWDYSGGFGVAQPAAPPRALDGALLEALGLTDPAALRNEP